MGQVARLVTAASNEIKGLKAQTAALQTQCGSQQVRIDELVRQLQAAKDMLRIAEQLFDAEDKAAVDNLALLPSDTVATAPAMAAVLAAPVAEEAAVAIKS